MYSNSLPHFGGVLLFWWKRYHGIVSIPTDINVVIFKNISILPFFNSSWVVVVVFVFVGGVVNVQKEH